MKFQELTNEQLKEIAIDFYEGKIFSDRHIPEHESSGLAMVFMPIALGAFSAESQEDLEKIGMIYEYMSEAGPRSCNGMPGFFSLRLLNRDQCKIMFEYYNDYRKLREEFVNA